MSERFGFISGRAWASRSSRVGGHQDVAADDVTGGDRGTGDGVRIVGSREDGENCELAAESVVMRISEFKVQAVEGQDVTGRQRRTGDGVPAGAVSGEVAETPTGAPVGGGQDGITGGGVTDGHRGTGHSTGLADRGRQGHRLPDAPGVSGDEDVAGRVPVGGCVVVRGHAGGGRRKGDGTEASVPWGLGLDMPFAPARRCWR